MAKLKPIKLVIPALALSALFSCGQSQAKKKIYIAWSDRQTSYSFISTLKTVEAIGCAPIVLDMVKSSDVQYGEGGDLLNAVDEHGILLSEYAEKVKANSWKHSNVADIAKDVDCVIFPGGSDICPTLYSEPQPWHGIESETDYSAVRDVSDYILMSYCLKMNIPMFAICRGMQMLSVVSGATLTQDIPTFFEQMGASDQETHRDKEKKVFASHDVDISDTSSLLYRITKTEKLLKVPSWHHQGVLSVSNTLLTATAETVTSGIKIIEAVERNDLTFCLGVQFHPEVAVRKWVDKESDADSYMDYDSAASFFNALANHN